jgi:hypothetical protein
LSFVLLGQPSLEQQLTACASLATQLTWRSEIKAFNRNEMRAYINSRIEQAQPKVNISIREDLFEVVFAESQGIVAKINAIMENCLIDAQLSQRTSIDAALRTRAAEIIRDAAREVQTLFDLVGRLEVVDLRTWQTACGDAHDQSAPGGFPF